MRRLETGITTATPTITNPTARRARAVIYLRVSTTSQVNTDFNPEGISIPAQREAVERKALSLNAEIVEEFVEPGKTATSVDKRPRFQDMMRFIRAQRDIDYVIAYHWNRVFRNSLDAAITKRELAKYGTRIVSTVIDMGETPEAALLETVLHAVDQYQSEATAADVRYKMSQKVKHGGSVGRSRSATATSASPTRRRRNPHRRTRRRSSRSGATRLRFYATGDYTLMRFIPTVSPPAPTHPPRPLPGHHRVGLQAQQHAVRHLLPRIRPLPRPPHRRRTAHQRTPRPARRRVHLRALPRGPDRPP